MAEINLNDLLDKKQSDEALPKAMKRRNWSILIVRWKRLQPKNGNKSIPSKSR